MTTREQEQMVARWMGWTVKYFRKDLASWQDPTGEVYSEVPDYAICADAWPPVFAELERRGLMRDFVDQMFRVIDTDLNEDTTYDDCWKFLTATPEQRLKALCAVIEWEGKQ